MALGDGFQGGFEVGVGIDAVELADLDHLCIKSKLK